MTIPDKEQLVSHVMKWVIKSGLRVESVSDQKHDFVIELYESSNLPQLQIIHPKADSAYVLIAGLVSIPESDRKKIKQQKREQFDDLIWDIKMRLLSMDVDFTVWGSESDPDSWEVQKRIFLDETNTNYFHESYQKVKNAIISIIWSYKRELKTTN